MCGHVWEKLSAVALDQVVGVTGLLDSYNKLPVIASVCFDDDVSNKVCFCWIFQYNSGFVLWKL